MNRYEAYCDFPDVWLSELPVHWVTHKMKYLFNERSEKGYPNEPLLVASQNMGVVPKGVYGNRTVEAQKDLHLLKLVRIGDFVISLRSFQGGLEYAYYQGIISPAYTVLIPHEPIAAGYFRYLAKSKLFIGLLTLCVTGIREGQNVDYGKLRDHLLPVPPRAEQDQIVRYLDWQVSKINRLIAAKKREISLFEEIKINHTADAVLHGIRNHSDYIETVAFGSIPAHWQVIQNKRLFCERVEHTETGTETLLSVSKHYGVKPSTELTEDEQFATLKPALSLVGYKVVHKNDLVMNIMRARNGSYGISAHDGIVSPAYCIYYATKECNVKYLHYFLRTPHVKSLFEAYSSGIAEHRRRLYPEDFLRLTSVLPPLEEQNEIVEYVEQSLVKYDAAIANLKQQITCLQDMKTRLISDVVTGQVDVRGIEVPEYKFVEDLADEQEDEQDEERAVE